MFALKQDKKISFTNKSKLIGIAYASLYFLLFFRRIMQFAYDAFNRPVTEVEPPPVTGQPHYEGSYSYNSYMELDTYTDNLSPNREWTFERANLGRLTKITDPRGYYKSFSYPEYASKRTVIDENGKKAWMEIDAAWRLLKKYY